MDNLELKTSSKILLGGIISNSLSIEKCDFSLIGYPLDTGSSFRTGCALASDELRNLLSTDNFECTTELGLDLNKTTKVKDWGNIEIDLEELRDVDALCGSLQTLTLYPAFHRLDGRTKKGLGAVEVGGHHKRGRRHPNAQKNQSYHSQFSHHYLQYRIRT